MHVRTLKHFTVVFPAGNAVVAATEVEEIVDAQWRDLGMPETLWHCHVKELGPLIVSIDTDGRNLFEENKVIFNQRKDKAIEEICKHVKFINKPICENLLKILVSKLTIPKPRHPRLTSGVLFRF